MHPSIPSFLHSGAQDRVRYTWERDLRLPIWASAFLFQKASSGRVSLILSAQSWIWGSTPSAPEFLRAFDATVDSFDG